MAVKIDKVTGNLKMRINSSILLFLIIFMASCQNDTRYHSYNSTSVDGWNKSDILVYDIPQSFEKGKYEIEIGIRHTEIYKYKNLWIEVKSNLTDAKKQECDSIQLILADKSGKWLGKGIAGIYQNDSLLTYNITVNNTNKAKMSIRHIMRDKQLKGIRDVGIKLIKVSE